LKAEREVGGGSLGRDLLGAVTRSCRSPLGRGVRAANADYYVERYRSTNVALALVSYFLLGLSSLRELQPRLQYDDGLATARLRRAAGTDGNSTHQG
jgi:hypothetical protein